MSATAGNSIKDYYIRLERMHDNVQNMLSAINQSLVSNASEVTVTVADSDDATSTLRIPSFLYLENKLEELDNNFGCLFNLPKSGEAWFTKNSSGTYKMNMVRSNTALPKPEVTVPERTGLVASITDNNILKDMVSPKTYIRYNIDNLADVAQSAMMKKYVFHNVSLYNSLLSSEFSSYSDFEALLDGSAIGTDYDTYESELKLPVRKDTYVSEFKVMSVSSGDSGIVSDGKTVTLTFDTLQYYDAEDASIVYYIKKGDKLIYNDSATEYSVLAVNDDGSVVLEETNSHINIGSYDENSANVFYIVNNDYNKYKYIDIPLEENDLIAVSVSVVWNGIRSAWSTPELIDLNSVPMTDASGNPVLDSSGNEMSYIEYYNKYCQNIGDLILGITEAAYPQLSNFTASQLADLQDGAEAQILVTSGIQSDSIKVVPINKHLTDDTTNDEIISLHQQKNELQGKLDTIQVNINDLTTKIQSTAAAQDSSSSIATMQTTLSSYYTEKTELTKQFNSCVSQLNEKAAALTQVQDKVKYRIRGLMQSDEMNSWVKSNFSEKAELVGIEIWYKYKSVNNDTSSLTVINSDTFTEWNVQRPEQKKRYLSFNSLGTGFVTEYVNYTSTDNIPKWNQVDIPIKNGEDVIFKVRYIYNIGQPFIELTSPWSDEVTISFPEEYKEDVQVSSIIDTNNDDTVAASFSSTLINDGYTDHINDKTVSNNNTFFHSAEHIYSGFNTAENNMMSLKEKLSSMISDINNYKELLDDAKKSKLKVSVIVDDTESEISENVTNKINLYNINNNQNKFIKKSITLKFTNTSEYNVRMYPLFPGNISLPLFYADVTSEINERISDYERVPMQVSKNISPQYMGQWIYFKQSSPYDNVDVYFNDSVQNNTDLSTSMDDSSSSYVFKEPRFDVAAAQYMSKNNIQVMLPYRYRQEVSNSLILNKQMISITKALQAMKAFMDEYGGNMVD